MAYHDNNKRELELTRHVSLRQLDPAGAARAEDHRVVHGHDPGVALRPGLPGPLHAPDQDVSLSIPSVRRALHQPQLHAQPAAQHCPDVSPLAERRRIPRDTDHTDDPRFVDYFGAHRHRLTSSGDNDSGMFETNLRDERFLPFEGAGAISTWTLSLPGPLRASTTRRSPTSSCTSATPRDPAAARSPLRRARSWRRCWTKRASRIWH